MNNSVITEAIGSVDAERRRLLALAVKLGSALEMLRALKAELDDGDTVPKTAPGKRGGKGVSKLSPPPSPKKANAKPPTQGSAKTGMRVIDRTLEVLRKFGRPLTVAKIAEIIGHNPKSLQQSLAVYVKRGMLVHTGRAEFGLPDPEMAHGISDLKGDLSGGAPARFSAYHLPEPHLGGFRCSRCLECVETIQQFTKYCRVGKGG